MGNFTRTTPPVRVSALMAFIKRIYDCPEAKACLDNWGLTLGDKTIHLQVCRVLLY